MADSASTTTSFSVPQHPLPEEIQRMERDETVCKFCGVSYLIHNEVKTLQKRLAEAEKTMEHYKGSVEREKILIEKMQKMETKSVERSKILKEQEQQLELFKGDLKMKANLINEMYSQKHQLKMDLEKSQKDKENLKTQLSQFFIVLPKLSSIVRQQKDSLNNLRKQAIEHKASSKDQIMTVKNNFGKVLQKIVQKVQSERKASQVKLQNLNKQLLESQMNLSNLCEADKQLSELQTSCRNLQNKITTYEKQASSMEEKNEILRGKCSAFEKELDVKLNKETKLKSDMEMLKTERQYEVLKHNETITKKDDEIIKLDALCKSLERVMNEKSVSEIETRERVTGKDIQVKALEKSLSNAKLDTENLRLEREHTIVAHHNRIEQLRESYSKKLEDTESSYSKLRKEFDHQQKIIEKDFEEEKMEMKAKFEKEKEDLNTEHNQQIIHLQTEIKDCNEKLEKEETVLKETKDQLYELKNALSTNKTKNAQDIQKYQNELLDLRRKLEDLEQSRRERKENMNEEGSSDKYKSVQKLLQDANIHIKMLKEQLKTNKNEMTILQNTVRQECEERLELTQALSNARMKLLASQQNSGAPRYSPTTKTGYQRLTNRQSVATKSADSVKEPSKIDTHTSLTYLGQEPRRTKSTGSDTPRPTRESVDGFRERIAVALGRPNNNRSNVTR